MLDVMWCRGAPQEGLRRVVKNHAKERRQWQSRDARRSELGQQSQVKLAERVKQVSPARRLWLHPARDCPAANGAGLCLTAGSSS